VNQINKGQSVHQRVNARQATVHQHVCPLHEALRHRIWTEETPMARELHGSLEDRFTAWWYSWWPSQHCT
jgi:hypothetical protein